MSSTARAALTVFLVVGITAALLVCAFHSGLCVFHTADNPDDVCVAVGVISPPLAFAVVLTVTRVVEPLTVTLPALSVHGPPGPPPRV